MKCDAFETQLQDLLDERACLKQDQQLDAHASKCQSCRETLAAAVVLQEGVDLFEVPDPSAEFSKKVVAASMSQSSPTTSRATLVISAIAVIAALLLVAIIPVAQNLLKPVDPIATDTDSQDSPNLSTENDKPSLVENDASPKNESSDDDLLDPMPDHDSGDSIAQRPMNNRSMVPLAGGLALPEFPSFRDMSEHSNRIPGVRPIRSSFGVVLGLLRRALPGGRDGEPDKPQAGVLQFNVTNLT